MKNLNIQLFTVLLITLCSCSNFLDLAPQHTESVNNFYQNPGDFDMALIGVYSQAQDYVNNSKWLELISDNSFISFQSAGISDYEFDEVEISNTNTHLIGMWRPAYNGIAFSNAVINRIANMEFGNQVQKDQFLGEAYFMRAWNYFNLVRSFGEIPISTSEITGPTQEYDKELKSVAEVYNLIISDLMQAKALLPVLYSNTKGRATKGAAIALLGKVYLTNGQNNEAATEFASVINGSEFSYELVSNYGSLFAQNNTNLSESVFEIEFTSGAGEGSRMGSDALPAPEGSGRNTPTRALVNLFAENDLRGSFTAILDGTEPYSSFIFDLYSKYFDPDSKDRNDDSANFLEIRFSDVLLMYAEALNNQAYGNAEAFTALNRIRERAGLNNLAKTDLPDKEAFALGLEQERRMEFANERKRWFDLIRTGRVIEVMNAHFESIGDNSSTVTEDELTFPIPKSETDLMNY